MHEIFHFDISPVELEEAILDENKRRRIAKSLQLSAERLPEASQGDYEDIDVGQELEAPKLIITAQNLIQSLSQSAATAGNFPGGGEAKGGRPFHRWRRPHHDDRRRPQRLG